MQFFLYHLDARKHHLLDENKEHVRLELRPISVVSLNQIIGIGGGWAISKKSHNKAFHSPVKTKLYVEFKEAIEDYILQLVLRAVLQSKS